MAGSGEEGSCPGGSSGPRRPRGDARRRQRQRSTAGSNPPTAAAAAAGATAIATRPATRASGGVSGAGSGPGGGFRGGSGGGAVGPGAHDGILPQQRQQRQQPPSTPGGESTTEGGGTSAASVAAAAVENVENGEETVSAGNGVSSLSQELGAEAEESVHVDGGTAAASEVHNADEEGGTSAADAAGDEDGDFVDENDPEDDVPDGFERLHGHIVPNDGLESLGMTAIKQHLKKRGESQEGKKPALLVRLRCSMQSDSMIQDAGSSGGSIKRLQAELAAARAAYAALDKATNAQATKTAKVELEGKTQKAKLEEYAVRHKELTKQGMERDARIDELETEVASLRPYKFKYDALVEINRQDLPICGSHLGADDSDADGDGGTYGSGDCAFAMAEWRAKCREDVEKKDHQIQTLQLELKAIAEYRRMMMNDISSGNKAKENHQKHLQAVEIILQKQQQQILAIKDKGKEARKNQSHKAALSSRSREENAKAKRREAKAKQKESEARLASISSTVSAVLFIFMHCLSIGTCTARRLFSHSCAFMVFFLSIFISPSFFLVPVRGSQSAPPRQDDRRVQQDLPPLKPW